ncbi:hypothetical protein C1882_18290 [Pseudomonas sp. FW305-E2]|uniref:hypothetical protein n=1 Tax=Pseudomonas sp. FW305-E2 TaxID=2075558 RepID=UPI000B4FBDB1|nr:MULTISPECIES: hypothetical protein [Pseudomonas]POA83699.1 hypothetical protein C1882_18290 [Pseudomonas sp. FW305-E2]
MTIYRVVWAIFMVLIVAPAFMLASSTEFYSLGEIANEAAHLLGSYYVPDIISAAVAYPIATLATILPSSSSLLPFFGDMIWKGVGVILLAAAFLNIRPPFYKKGVKE